MKIKYTNHVFLKGKSPMLFIMKTFIFLFCTAVFSFSPAKTFSQNAKIKIAENHSVTVDEVFELIRRQTKYTFIYEDGLFKNLPKVQLKKGEIDANVLLEKSLGQGSFKVVVSANNAILISEKPADPILIKGVVSNAKKEFLIGATVWVKGTKNGAVTNFDGTYEIKAKKGDVLVFEYMGYKKLEVTVSDSLIINPILLEDVNKLDEVKIVSTGYQKIDRERSTGSFAVITAKDLEKFNTSNVINRLEGQVAGLQIDLMESDNTFVYGNIAGDGAGQSSYNFAIRGKSTFESNDMPLIVLDGTPTEMDIRTINPNDIEKVTFLKDAAAASIYGARAANGVMVIDTKKGKPGQTSINFSQSYGFSNNPTLSKFPLMNSAQVLNLEQELVDKRLVNDPAGSSFFLPQTISQGMELMFQEKRGQISTADKDVALGVLRNRNTFSQVEKYLLQPSTTENYNLSISGGGENDYSYLVSGSYSKEKTQSIGNEGQRLTFLANQDFKLFDYIKLNTSLRGSIFKFGNNGLGFRPLGFSRTALLPYDQIVDDNGNSQNYYRHFYSGVTIPLEQKGYQPWTYNYIDEMNNSNNYINEQNYGAVISATIPLLKGLDAVGNFTGERSYLSNENFYNENTYFTRDIINTATSVNNSGDLVYGFPRGGIVQNNNVGRSSYTVRGQLNYDGIIGEDHLINAIGGIEARQVKENLDSGNLYGYNFKTQTSIDIPSQNYVDVNGWMSTASYGNVLKESRRRFLSYYANAGYTFKNTYTLTGSARLDDYNNFGVDKKLRRTPLWSTGAKWIIKNESFLKDVELFNSLSLRASYGFNGNINMDTFPFTNISLQNSDPYSQQPFAEIMSSANPFLRWEKTGILNFGLDFAILNNRLSGTIEYYTKNSQDLIVEFPVSPFYGLVNDMLIRNAANLKAKGVDFSLNGTILKTNNFSWNSTLIVSYNRTEVTDSRFSDYSYYLNGNGLTAPVKGYPLNSVFAFRSAGLDANGATQVYDKSGNIVNSFTPLTDIDDVKYMGTNIPAYYGSLSHTINYKKLSLFILATYKFDYVMFKPTFANYVSRGLFNQYDLNADIDQRWRNPGDEVTTDVPGVQGMGGYSYNRYVYGENKIIDGDHIRFRELSLKYDLSNLIKSRIVRSASITCSARNLGFFWRKNKDGLDPDFLPYTGSNMKLPPMALYSIGFNVNF